MAYEPLHHKYRPQTFAQLAGQEAIANALTNAIAAEKIAPAYLFTGPRGTGKTSSARILAKSLNCLESSQPTPQPCGQCEACRSIAMGTALDVIEIDAASNTGVDNMREIIEKAQFAPVQCRYKVYVIDECHMLSIAAFNALLKTLEEPPARVVFVLATTDPQRVLPTIISRCQRFDFRRIRLEAMVSHLHWIATQEDIEIAPEAIALVAQIANGGLRDAESLLEQLSLFSGTITPEKVWDLVGSVPERDLLELLKGISSDRPEIVLRECRKLMERGREPLAILQNLASFYLNLLIAKTAPSLGGDMAAITEPTWHSLCQEAHHWQTHNILQGQKYLKESEAQIKNTTQPRLWLEVTLLGLLPSALNSPATATTAPEVEAQTPPPTDRPQTTEGGEASSAERRESISLAELKQKALENIDSIPANAFLKDQCTLVSFNGNLVKIGVKNKFLFEIGKRQLGDIEAGFSRVCGHPVKVSFQMGDHTTPSEAGQTAEENQGENQQPPATAEPRENEPSPPLVPNLETTGNLRETLNPKPTSPSSHNSSGNAPRQSAPLLQPEPEKSFFSASDVYSAAQSLAKSVSGEIIFSEPKQIKITLTNRPNLSELSEEDLPF